MPRISHNNSKVNRNTPYGMAFTLIELLVVIVIISMLIAILLPALSTVRETARSAGCLSNQRQMALAAYAYSAEYDGYIINQRYIDYLASGEDHHYWMWDLATYLNVGEDFSGPWLTHSTTVKAGYNAVESDIPNSLRIYICPSEEGTFLYGPYLKYGINIFTSSFWGGVNSAGKSGEPTSAYDGTPKWKRFEDVSSKGPLSQYILITDTATTDDPLRYREASAYSPFGFATYHHPNGSQGFFSDRHVDSGNALYLDGHASNEQWDSLAREASDPGLYAILTKHWRYGL